MPSDTPPVTADDVARAMQAIRGLVRETPIIEVPGSEIGIDATLVFKLEFLQHSGSFKGRGATHFVATQPISEAGVVAASGGNHGAAVAFAAQRAGYAANIFVPVISSPAKVDRLRQYGATVHQVGAVYAEALAASEAFLAETDATAIHAYEDPVVVAGAGTCSLELDEQTVGLDAALFACGGGGLVGGAAAWFGDRLPLVACETVGTSAYAIALDVGHPVDVEISGAAADALGATSIGWTPWQVMRAARVGSAVVTDEALLEAKELLWRWLRIVVEPSAAAPLAALTSGAWTPVPGSRIGVVLCGANTTLG